MEVVFPMQITDTWFAISIKVPVQRMLFDKILNMFWKVVCPITYSIKTKGTIEMYSYYPFFGFLFVFLSASFFTLKCPFIGGLGNINLYVQLVIIFCLLSVSMQK